MRFVLIPNEEKTCTCDMSGSIRIYKYKKVKQGKLTFLINAFALFLCLEKPGVSAITDRILIFLISHTMLISSDAVELKIVSAAVTKGA